MSPRSTPARASASPRRQNEEDDFTTRGAERHAHAQLASLLSCGERGHTVNAEGGEQQAEQPERTGQPRGNLLRHQRNPGRVGETPGADDRQVRIQRSKHPADRGHRAGGPLPFHEERHVRRRFLRVRHVDVGHRRFAQRAVLAVARDADDQKLGTLFEDLTGEPLPDRLALRPGAPRERLVHNRHGGRTGAIRRREAAPRENRHPQRFEVPRRHDIPVGLDRLARIPPRRHDGSKPHPAAGERDHPREGRRGHARDPPRALQQRLAKPHGRLAPMSAHRQIERDDIHAGRIEPRIDPARLLERPREERGREEEQARERHLSDEQRAPEAQPSQPRGALVLQARHEIRLRRLQRRHEPGEHAREQADGHGEQEHARIEGDVHGDGERQHVGTRGEEPR